MGRPLIFVALRACYGQIAAPLVSNRGTAAVDGQKQTPLVSNRGTAVVGTWSSRILMLTQHKQNSTTP